jgi:hypothetical protein
MDAPRSRSRASDGTRRSRPSSRASVAGAGGGDLAATAAWHRDDVRRGRSGAAAVRPPRSAAGALRAWLPADTLALCGAEAPLFLALDKLDDMVQRVRGEGRDAQASLLKRLDASLQARGLAHRAARAQLGVPRGRDLGAAQGAGRGWLLRARPSHRGGLACGLPAALQAC